MLKAIWHVPTCPVGTRSSAAFRTTEIRLAALAVLDINALGRIDQSTLKYRLLHSACSMMVQNMIHLRDDPDLQVNARTIRNVEVKGTSGSSLKDKATQ
jgi:hypothetical protein